MKCLAIDTAGSAIEIALILPDKVSFFREESGKKASEILLAKIDEMLSRENLTIADMDCYACATGPGSFTGIRIGLNTVKTFSFVTGKKIIAVNSLKKLAYKYKGAQFESIVCVVKAYASLCFVGVYSPDMTELMSPRSMTYDEAKQFVSLVDEPRVLCCDAESATELGVDGGNAEDSLVRACQAEMENTCGEDYRTIEPFYLLKSQAEREKGE